MGRSDEPCAAAAAPAADVPIFLGPLLCSCTQALVHMRENFEEINRLCAECQSLIDCHDKIAVLSEVHYNLRKTLQVTGARAGPVARAGWLAGWLAQECNSQWR